MADDRPGPRRVKRLHNACEECRRRKIRCDSEMMPDNVCSSCLNLGIACDRNKVYLKRGPKPGSTRTAVASQPVNVIVASILAGTSSEPFNVPGDKETTRKILTKLANRIQELEKELERALATHAYFPKDLPSYANTPPESADHADSPDSIVQPEDSSNVDELSKQLSHFSFGLPTTTHFGESSNFMLMVAALNHRAQLQGSNLPDWRMMFSHVKRPEFWGAHNRPIGYLFPESPQSLEFPPHELMCQYIDAYFVEREIYSPLLHRPTFDKQISEGLHLRNSAFGAVVLAVCAIGAQNLSPDPNRDKPGQRWFNQIRLESFVFSPRLELCHLQLYCLAIHYFHSLAAGIDLGWLLSGIAIRRSQEKGAHRRYTLNSEGPSIQGELWKRAFWQLVVIDSRMCTLFGRPRGTSILDFDLDPLVECDDEYWEAQGSREAFTQPPGKPSIVSYWNCYLRLIEIYGFAQLTIYAVRKTELSTKMGIGNIEWYEKAVMELDSALNQWVDSVPEHLKWDNQKDTSVFFSQSAILYSLYYWVQIQVHRMFIPRPGQSYGILSFPSLAICTNAARSIIRVCETHITKKSLLYPHFLISLFNSATVLALNLTRSVHQKLNFDPARELSDIYKCIELLRLYEARHPLSGRLVDTINMIMFASYQPPRIVSDVRNMPTDTNYTTRPSGSATVNTNTDSVASNAATTFSASPQVPTTSTSSWSEQTRNLPFSKSELGQLPVHGSGRASNDILISTTTSGPSGSVPGPMFQLSNNNIDNPGIQPTATTDNGSFTTSSNAAASASASGTGNFIPTPIAAPGFMMPDTWRSLYGEMRQPEQDWNTFLAGVDQLLNNGQYAGFGVPMNEDGSGLGDFDPFNF
ncbi:hypothetical protein K435DRAFT_778270 [Dendrothele bispora CBS 962.96]|uniref:Zn(2)-C6 fungal-type domain-containing protein n=1 Tax=Dendrothele bispora (strain CBS 962.96) TaxID=1314807 RepID=A0A4S8M5G3_DENBC|nr:hypothetical protein K435DRAFT_778270 [Dendrothele bispora CBS 962.96]